MTLRPPPLPPLAQGPQETGFDPRGAAAPPGPLLTSKQMAAFVAHGFLRFDEVVPPDMARAALDELAAGGAPTGWKAPGPAPAPRAGQPLAGLWAASPAIGPVLRLPRVAAIIESLLGPGALYDHHYAHVIPPRQPWSQPWHADAVADPRPLAFDVQLMFFFHDTPREMGGTMILPGSHLRRANELEISRLQNFVGQLPIVCPAGTLVVCHHGMWHCGQPNHTDRPRTMFKLRLGPGGRQVRRWDLADLDDPDVARTLRHEHPFAGSQARLEIVNRIKLWRYLTGDAAFDLDYWLGRMAERG